MWYLEAITNNNDYYIYDISKKKFSLASHISESEGIASEEKPYYSKKPIFISKEIINSAKKIDVEFLNIYSIAEGGNMFFDDSYLVKSQKYNFKKYYWFGSVETSDSKSYVYNLKTKQFEPYKNFKNIIVTKENDYFTKTPNQYQKEVIQAGKEQKKRVDSYFVIEGLPLDESNWIKKVATYSAMKKIAKFLIAKQIKLGDTIENGTVRYHRYRGQLEITDIEFAGRRGKKCRVTSISAPFINHDKDRDLDFMFARIADAKTYDDAIKQAKGMANSSKDIKLEMHREYERRAIDVDPPVSQTKPIKLETRNLSLFSTPTKTSIEDKIDTNNVPRAYGTGSAKDLKALYLWIVDNEEKIKRMTFSDLVMAMSKAKLNFRDYLSMD